MAAGDPVKALDAPPAVNAADSTTVATAASTVYAQLSPVVGVAFTAPTSGRVKITFRARFECKLNGSRVVVSAELATGATVGSGTVLNAASDDEALESTQSATATTTPAETRMNAAQYRYITGLTAGTTYNAYVVVKGFTASNGTVYSRGILVEPLP
jgi:hypothetical protein